MPSTVTRGEPRPDHPTGSATSGEPMVTVVLPMRNAAPTIRTQVEALLRQDCAHPWELVVVDNGSGDASGRIAADALRGHRPPTLVDAVVVPFTDRQGFASPRNHGVGVGRGGLIAFCDADDEVDPSWLGSLLRAAGLGHELVASRVVPLPAGQDLPAAPLPSARLPELFEVPVAHTGGMLCSRRLFLDLGGFDPLFDQGGEDVDFSLRARLAGHAPHLAQDAVYFARSRPSARGQMKQAYRNGRTHVRLFARHRGALHLQESPWSLGLRRVSGLVRKSPALLSGSTRAPYTAQLGVTVGRLIWSARLRVRHF